jgi:hypothetical protein
VRKHFNKNFVAPKVPTMTDEWVSANKDYKKFQKANPIFGKRLMDLSCTIKSNSLLFVGSGRNA